MALKKGHVRLTPGLYTHAPTYTKRGEQEGERGGEDSLVFQVKGHGAILNSHIFSDAVLKHLCILFIFILPSPLCILLFLLFDSSTCIDP